MWTFQDKGSRDVCLIPEVTAICQELWREKWKKNSRNKRLFYLSRCYRYEQPQAGRYREFNQFGIELLGESSQDEVINLLKTCLNKFPISYELCTSVKRGLDYYIQDGFEVECSCLGVCKQIAGGGAYAEGIGWAIGVERLILAMEKSNEKRTCRT